MPQNRLDRELIQKISPAKVAEYLEYKGWRKEREADGIASIWSYVSQNKRITLLLPLNRDFADFQIQVEELLLTLAKVEQRPETEVLKALANLSVIAQRGDREVIDIKIESAAGEKDDKHEASAKASGAVLKSLGNLFEALGDAIKKKTKIRSLKTDVKSELNLALLDVFQGSFGIRTGLGVYQEHIQLNFLEEPVFPASQEATEKFMNLIAASSSGSPELLKREIAELSKDSLAKFKSFIKSLISLDANLVLEWGSVNPEKGRTIRFTLDKIIQALEIISKIELENPDEYEVTGKLVVAGIGQGKEKRIFILVDETNSKEYKGHISLELINTLNNYIELDRVYRATIEETLGVNEATGEEIRLYTLIGLQELSNES